MTTIKGALLLAALMLWPVMASAQMVTSLAQPATVDQLAAMQAQMPVPADSVPPAEAVGGAAGTAPTYRRGDAIPNRISRSAVFAVVGTAGMISGTWVQPLPANAASYPMFFTGIGPTGTMGIDCIVVTSTNAGFSAQCRQNVLNLGLLSSPLSILAPAGTQVYALALPSTQ